jgi:ABC-type glutathione transport system ATPase component
MKNLDHVRMTSRRLSYILQQQLHLYTPEANQIREQIDRYVEAERQIEGEMARRRIRDRPPATSRSHVTAYPARDCVRRT